MKGFQVDYTTESVYKEIQKLIKEQTGVDVSIETVDRIMTQRSLDTVDGMRNGHTVCYKYFGNFVATPERVKALNDFYHRKGLSPTLVDNGFMRLTFKKDGTLQTGEGNTGT